MSLTRDKILASRPELPRERLAVPDLGGDVFVRVLTLKEVADLQRETKRDEPLKLYPKIVALGCVAEDGSPLFVGEDVKLIETLPWPAVHAIAAAIQRINRLGDDATDPKA